MEYTNRTIDVKIKAEDAAILGLPESEAENMTVLITSINNQQHPAFSPSQVLKTANGPDILILVSELRQILGPYEGKVFTWFGESPDNPRQFITDPLGSLKKMGMTLDQTTWDKLNKLGELIKQEAESGMK